MNPFDIDLKSSTVEKFIDVISTAIGKLSAPYLLRKMAKAKGQEMLVMAESIEKTKKMIGDDFEVRFDAENFKIIPREKDEITNNLTIQRIESRLSAIEEERQKNIDNITIYGLLEAAKISETSNEKIDRDWLNQFINVSQDVSSDQMQKVWGQILAREISKPGSFSLRSLEVLRTISKQEAEKFGKLVQFLFCVGDDMYIFSDFTKYNSGEDGWNDYILLNDIGLFMSGIFTVKFRLSTTGYLIFKYGNLSFKATASKDTFFMLNAYPLSSVGKELSRLIPINPSRDYFEKVKKEVSEKEGVKCIS